MSLLDEYRDRLIMPEGGSANPEIQKKTKLTYDQMQIYYSPKETKPKISEFGGGMPDSILRSRLSFPFRRILHDPNNVRIWNRIDNRRPLG